MPFFSKLKQKLAKQNFTNSQKSVLAIFSVACFFIFFYPHIALAQTAGEEYIVIPILQLALKFTGFLLSLAETIFQWIVNPTNMLAVIDNKIIYQIWRTVRDVFNVAFIMVLLFSAFATIFQSAANFNYKKVLLNLVIMALLVNFSYPIARFIIDASNMLMYGFLGKIGGSNSFLAVIKASKLDQIFSDGAAKSPDTLFLLSAVIFTFIFAITLLVIAVLLVIRTVTLAVYVIFSPIAFVGSILPGTALAEAGSKWWKDFMQQCFAGPIMIFMLYVALEMIKAISASGGSMTKIAFKQVGDDVTMAQALRDLISSASFFVIPIIILWLGIIKAQQSGIAGAGAVVRMGQRAGRWLARNPALGSAGFISRQFGITDAVRQRWDQARRNSPLGQGRVAQRAARLAGAIGVRGSMEKDMRRRAEEHKKSGTTRPELEALARSGDAAAAFRLAEDKDLDQATYDAFVATPNATRTPTLTTAINSKVKQNRLDIVANNRATDRETQTAPATTAGVAAVNAARADALNPAGPTTPAGVAEQTRQAARLVAGMPSPPPIITPDQYIANQQMGNLSADQWNAQDWTAALQAPTHPPASATSAQRAAYTARLAAHARTVEATRTAWVSLTDEAQREVRTRLSGNNRAALLNINVI
jgi:hypothetical protein